MRTPEERPWVAYVIAVVAPGAAWLLREGLDQFLTHRPRLIVFGMAVLLAAWRGGLGPGLVATGVSTVIVAGRALPNSWDEMLLGFLVSLGISGIAEQMHRALRRERVEAGARRAGEERYRDLVEAQSEMLCRFQPDGKIIFANAAYARMRGTTADALVGQNFWNFIPSSEHAGVRAMLEQITPEHPETVIENVLATERGPRWTLWSNRALRFDAAGRAVELQSSGIDISARKQVEEALRIAKEQAEAASQAKDRFLAALSHELRTPLTPVLMTASALQNDPAVPEEYRRDFAMIRRNIELETKLIDDLLDLSRITSGKLALDLEPVDLNEAVRRVVGICELELQEKAVRLTVETASEPIWVRADSGRLQQVLWNVLRNAIKFTPSAGRIAIRTAPSAESGRVSVTDTGIGIPADALLQVFDAFEQGGAAVTRQFGGLGLGLAISKALVEMQHGSIRAESAGPGQGATFTVSLPLTDERSPAASLGAPRVARNGTRPRVLLVEDHLDTAQTLAHRLGLAGYPVTCAADVASALQAAGGGEFDVIVSDLSLPDGTGHDLMRRLRETRPICGIAMSGFGTDDDVQRSRAAGFTEHLIKPVDCIRLEDAIERAIRKQ